MFPRCHSQSVNALPPTPASKFKVPLNVEMLSALLPAWRAAWTIVNLSRQNREGPRKAKSTWTRWLLGGLLYDIF